MKPNDCRCTSCGRTFRTPQGLGLHFRHAKRNPKVCKEKKR